MNQEHEHQDRQYPESRPRRRRGRGKLISVDGRSWKERPDRAEHDPEGTVSSDQCITEAALHSADSDTSEPILRSREQAATAVEHILTAVPPNQRDVLLRVLPVLECDESLNSIARKVGLAPVQISRAFESAKNSDRWRIFKQAKRDSRPPAIVHTKYQPAGVSHECYMMPHQGAVMASIGGLDKRTSLGVNVTANFDSPDYAGANVPDGSATPQRENEGRESHPQDQALPSHQACNPYRPSNGCQHNERQWLQVGFGDLRLTCLCCRAELDRKNPYVRQP